MTPSLSQHVQTQRSTVAHIMANSSTLRRPVSTPFPGVTLSGWVTPDRDKAGEIFERVAKLRGVQEVQSSIETLPANRQDPLLRRTIARRLFASVHFARFGSMSNPPFRIIVDNGVVTLFGYVQSDAERIEMELIVGQTQGIVRVDSQLQTLR